MKITNITYPSINNYKSFKAKKEISNIEITKVNTPSLLTYLHTQTFTKPVNVEFKNTLEINKMIEKYGLSSREIVNDLNKRAGQKGQVLNWIKHLQQNQLQRIDEIYNLAETLKQNNSNKLIIIGIGGSKHTIENILTLNGFEDKVEFISASDPDSINNFYNKKIKGTNPAILVASKSGTTLEPSYDFEMIQKLLGKDFKNYVCITDANSTKSKLRQIANEKGYKCGIIHDDCGGRFGAFDDHALVALAYCGMPKEKLQSMLKASINAQQKFLNPNLNENIALQRAVFNTESVINEKTNQYDYYFGDCFEGTTLWNTQLKKESHKSLYKVSGDLIGPAFLHNSTEADLDENNITSFYTFNRVKNNNSKDYQITNALFNGSLKAYSDRHPVSVITLKDLTPESIAEFIELKHFETIYTGMLLRKIKNKDEQNVEILPEVQQPHVGIYKAEVNKILEK